MKSYKFFGTCIALRATIFEMKIRWILQKLYTKETFSLLISKINAKFLHYNFPLTAEKHILALFFY